MMGFKTYSENIKLFEQFYNSKYGLQPKNG